MAGEGSNVGSIFGRLGFHFDSSGSREFDAVRRRLKGETDKPIEQRLGATVDDSEINRYNRQLEEIRQRNKRREDFKARLGADYDPRAFNAYERDLRRAQRGEDDMVRSSAKLHTAFGNIYGRGGALFAAAGGLYGLVNAFKSVTGAYQESQVSQVKLQTQLKASGIAYRDHATEIDRVIQKTSQLAGLDDEDLQDAFTNIVRVTGDVSKSLRLTGLAADFARAKHMDVAKAGELVGKVAGGNLGILSRYGIVLQKGATATEALGVLQQKFGGQAAAYGRTQAGSLDRVQVAWENLRETIGEKLAPTITKAANGLANFINEVDNGTGTGGKFRRTLEQIFGALKDGEHWIKDHIGLIKLAATAWIGYRTAALAAAAASKVAALAAASSGAAGAGARAAAGGAGAAAAGGAAASRVGRFASRAAGPTGLVVGAGGFKAITDAIRGASSSDLGLLNRYAGALERVAKAGDSGGMRKLAAQLRETAAANSDITKGDHLKAFADALDTTAKGGGSDLRALQAAFKAMGKSSGGELDKAARAVKDYGSMAKVELNTKLGRTLSQMDNRWEISRGGTGLSLKAIRKYVVDNMRDVKQHLGKDSEDGKQALAHNFEGAVGEIRQQMRAGKTTTKDGMAAIRGYLAQELRLYGFSISQARNIAATGDPDANRGREGGAFRQRGGLVKRARGGWIGGKGMVGDDTVPVGPNALAAPGEFHAAGSRHDAIINRHQAPLANLFMLASGGPFQSLDDLASRGRGVDQVGYLDSVMGPIGGLAGLFSAITRPHMYAQGGTLGGAVSAANQFERAHFPYKWGGGHQASPVPFGPVDCSAAVSYILQHAGVNIPTMVSGQLARAGKPGPGALTVYANPEHTLMRIGTRFFGTSTSNPGGGAGWIDPPPSASYLSRFAVRHFDGTGSFGVNVKAPRIRGGGAVGQVAQRALNVAAAAANRFGNRAINSMGLGMGDPNNELVGGGNSSQNMRLGQRMAAGRGWAGGLWTALRSLWTRESGWRTTATNPTSGAYGIPQALPGSKMATSGADWRTNPATQIRWGLGYIAGRYGNPAQALAHENAYNWYRGGGFMRRFQGGGFTDSGFGSPFGGLRTAATGFAERSGLANIGGLKIRSLGKKIRHGVGDYDALMGDHGTVDTLRNRYSLLERMYNRIDDGDLVDEKTGQLNTPLWNEKLRDLAGMGIIAQQIEKALKRAQAIAKRTLTTYRRLVRQLSGSLRHASKKDRGGLRQRLKDAREGVTEWSGNVSDLGFDVPNAHLDWLDLGDEMKDLQGGVASAQQSFNDSLSTGDTSGVDGGGITADQQAQLDQVDRLKAIVTQGNFLNAAGLRSLSVFDSNRVGTAGYAGAGGQANPYAPTSPAGGGGGGGFTMADGTVVPAGQPLTVINVSTLHPGDPQTLQAIAKASNAGNSYLGAVQSPRQTLGV